MRALQELEAGLMDLRSTAPTRTRRPRAARDVNLDHRSTLSPLERVATWVTTRVGTMGFFLIVLTWTVLWLGWNILAPEAFRFDPFPAFVFWLFVSNMIQIHLMPLIMVGQNLQARHAELRADAGFATNQKAELEVEQILDQLEHQRELIAHQGDLILQILWRMEATPAGPAEGSAQH